jgi:hypothetical protein
MNNDLTSALIPQTAKIILPGIASLYTQVLELPFDDLIAELTLDPLTVEPVSLPILSLD